MQFFMRLLITILIFFILSSISAQQSPVVNFEVQGRVLLQNGNPAPLASISLLSQQDSVLRASAVSDTQGAFSLTASPGNYLLKITLLSYQDKTIPGIRLDRDINLGELTLATDIRLLKEVVITSEKPQMKLELDKRVYNVGKDLSNAGGTAADILNNIPSVTVDVDGEVSFRGSQGVRILIDGKPSALVNSPDALRQLPGNMIESIEVITNPSARYEAAGEAGIINIILKKNNRMGLNGTFLANLGYPNAFGGSFNINYRKKNLNFFTTYGVDYRSTPGMENQTSNSSAPTPALPTFKTGTSHAAAFRTTW